MAWDPEPAVITAVAIVGIVYGRGVRTVWHHARYGAVVSASQVGALYVGLLTVLLALCSPLDTVADALFSAHMVQHLALIVVAAPLIAAGAPVVPMLWGLPPRYRVRVGRWWTRSRLATVFGWLTFPSIVWILHTVTLWMWHIPGPYTVAVQTPWVHIIEHACFFFTSLALWWTVFQRHRVNRVTDTTRFVLLFATLAQSTALGAMLVFARTAWYPVHAAGVVAWHTTLLDDQRAAGLIMWVPMGLAYIAAMLAILARALRAPIVA